MLKILGIIDLIAGIGFLLTKMGMPEGTALFFVFLVLAKGIIFIKNPVSWLDIIASFFILLFFIFPALSFLGFAALISAIWLLQKGLFSLI
jgi:hypothetical protein